MRKLVVAKDKTDHARLDALFRRGRTNGIPPEEISEKQENEIRPHAKTCQGALCLLARQVAENVRFEHSGLQLKEPS